PRATQMTVGKATGEELTDMMIKIGRLSFIVLMFIFGAFLFFGHQFVLLWVGKTLGPEGSYEAWLIAILIMAAYTLPLVQGFGNSILEAKSKLAFKAILYLSFMILGTILGAVLSTKYGALGMITGSVIAWVIVQNTMNFYYHNKIGLNIIRFFKQLLNKTGIAIVLAFGIAYFINMIPGNDWFNFVYKAIIFTIIYSALMYTIGLNTFEKDLFKKPINKLLKRQ
ncbi:MAG: lipopolysaccharide biosynthesis protein, partial [Cellulophaga sp.]